MTEFMNNKMIVQAIKKEAAEKLPPGSVVTLYGSRARGDERPDSDWDLHILVPGEHRLSATQMSDISWPFDCIGLRFNAEINTLVYTFADWARRSGHSFYKNVVRDGQILFKN